MQSTKKTVLVCGGAGFIGSSYLRLLLNEGYRVICLDAFTYAGHMQNLTQISSHPDFELVKGSIGDTSLVSYLLFKNNPVSLVNFAAETHVDRSISGPGLFVDTNVVGVSSLLRSSQSYFESLSVTQKSEFRFVQVSTDEVFGSLGPTGKFTEKSPITPNSPYSASKAAGDHLVRAWYHTYGLPAMTTHCSNNYGPRQFPEKLIPYMIFCALNDKPLPVYGDGKNVRDWIHVEDHCFGILKTMQKGKPGELYCFGGNEEWTNIDLVHKLCAHLDELSPRKDGKSYTTTIKYVQDRLGHDRRYAIDDTFAAKELGFVRKHKFSTGLFSTIEWYLQNQEWVKSVMEKKS